MGKPRDLISKALQPAKKPQTTLRDLYGLDRQLPLSEPQRAGLAAEAQLARQERERTEADLSRARERREQHEKAERDELNRIIDERLRNVL